MHNCITIQGAWMYPREAIPRMISLVRSGLLDLGQFSVTEFPLARANEAVAHAAANGGPFRMTVLKPTLIA
jgi:alcohol dehydrogenase